MASFVALPNGKTRAFIDLQGTRKTKTFDSKGGAKVWAATNEAEIMAGARGEIPNKVFGDVLRKYRESVTPLKKGARWEALRIGAVLGNQDPTQGPLRTPDPLALVPLRELDSTHVAAWRDRRLAAGLKPGSVRREWNILSAVCAVAIGEWKWLRFNPFSGAAGVKRPPPPPHRDETFSPEDIDVLQAVADAQTGTALRRVMRVVRFGIESAMRAGEIISLGEHPERVDTVSRVAHLAKTKNGSKRDVPLSAEAVSLWETALVTAPVEGNTWGLTSATLDAYWRELRGKAEASRPEVSRLHFHDTRHTAITRLAKRLQILDLARMTGHKNLNELMTYYNESAAEIAKLL